MSRRSYKHSRWLRFSLRSLIVIVLIASVGFAGLFYEVQRAEGRRLAVERLRNFPGFVQYENNPRQTKQKIPRNREEPGPVRRWLTEQFGFDLQHNVKLVCLNGRGEFSDEDFAATCRLRELNSLRLGRTAVTDEAFESITQLQQLSRLSISSPHLSNRAISRIARLPELEYLSLFETQITDAGLAELGVLHNLKTLVLRKTQVTAEGVQSLQAALPNCKITLKN